MSDSISPFLKAIIFDVDGTLAETEGVHRQAFNAAFRAFGMPWQWDVKTYRKLLSIGGGRDRFQAFLAQMGAGIDPVLITNLHQEKSRIYAAWVAAGHLHARPGVLRLLTEARAAGIRLACATSSQRPAVTALLHSLLGSDAAENTFVTLGCGDDAIHKKPAPDIYLRVMEQLGVETTSCIVIEDTALGLAAANAAGLLTVVTISTYSEPFDHESQLFTKAVAVLSNLGEPDQPFTTLAGEVYGKKVVDLSLLQLWLAGTSDPMAQ